MRPAILIFSEFGIVGASFFFFFFLVSLQWEAAGDFTLMVPYRLGDCGIQKRPAFDRLWPMVSVHAPGSSLVRFHHRFGVSMFQEAACRGVGAKKK